MEKIKSFQIDHNKLDKGFYISRKDDDIFTYDIRMCKPNGGVYLENAGLHTFEHLFATYVRNSPFTGCIVYVGPMGCRTGFYFLQHGMNHGQVIALLQETFRFIADYEGDIPGNTAIECGNYLDHDLATAKRYGAEMCEVLNGWTTDKMKYPE